MLSTMAAIDLTGLAATAPAVNSDRNTRKIRASIVSSFFILKVEYEENFLKIRIQLKNQVSVQKPRISDFSALKKRMING